MKPLAERHADRARRIVENGTEIGATTAGSLGTVAAIFTDFQTAFNRLSDEEKDSFKESMGELEVSAGVDSLAEAPDGSGRTMAGVGVVNTKVVPAGVDAPEAGNGGGTNLKAVDGWGANASPAATTETTEGSNLAGAALQEQGAGSDGKASTKAAKTPAPAPANAPKS